MIATGLGQVASGGDTEFDAKMLKENRHEIGNHDNGQERVAKLRPARQLRGPISRIHVTYRDEKTGSGKREQFSPKRSGRGNNDAAVNFRERDLSGGPSPTEFRVGHRRLMLVHSSVESISRSHI